MFKFVCELKRVVSAQKVSHLPHRMSLSPQIALNIHLPGDYEIAQDGERRNIDNHITDGEENKSFLIDLYVDDEANFMNMKFEFIKNI